ncbi:hypothetical protein HJG43_01270 [Kineosporiaceae bacterium SCSIO 59966]|nr:hypothetical protein HJG43_01270 [Kineosporiaceae bacterium SCSIO 59966]
MIVLAALLLVAVAAVVVFVVVAGTETVRMEWEALSLAWEPTALGVFLLGALAMLLLGLALVSLRAGTRRRTEQRRELKRLQKVERKRTDPQPEHAATGKDTRPAPVADSGSQRDTSRPVAPRDPGPGGTSPGDDGSWYDEPRRQG